MDKIVPLGPETSADFICDVETPTIHSVGGITVPIGIHPAASDREEVSFYLRMQIFFSLLVGDLDEFRHAFQAPPPCVLKLVLVLGGGVVEVVDVKPGGVSRGLLFFPQIGKSKKFSRTVVENSIDDDAESSVMGLQDEFEKLLVGRAPFPARGIGCFSCGEGDISFRIGTKVGIGVVKGAGVILVKRGRLENGIEIEGGNSELFEVVEPINDTLKIASIAAGSVGGVDVGTDLFFPIFKSVPLLGPRHNFPFRFGFVRYAGVFGGGIILGITVPEPLRKNLVPDRFLGPRAFFRNSFLSLRKKRQSKDRHQPKQESEHKEFTSESRDRSSSWKREGDRGGICLGW